MASLETALTHASEHSTHPPLHRHGFWRGSRLLCCLRGVQNVSLKRTQPFVLCQDASFIL